MKSILLLKLKASIQEILKILRFNIRRGKYPLDSWSIKRWFVNNSVIILWLLHYSKYLFSFNNDSGESMLSFFEDLIYNDVHVGKIGFGYDSLQNNRDFIDFQVVVFGYKRELRLQRLKFYNEGNQIGLSDDFLQFLDLNLNFWANVVDIILAKITIPKTKESLILLHPK